MAYLTTFIQDEETGNALKEIDGTIIPAYVGEEIYIESFYYYVTKVSLYCRQFSTGEQDISETIWVKDADYDTRH